MDGVTVLVAALLSFTIVDIIKRGRQSRLLSLFAHVASLARLALPFGFGRAAPGSMDAGATTKPPRSSAQAGRPSPTAKAGRVRSKRARKR